LIVELAIETKEGLLNELSKEETISKLLEIKDLLD